MVSRGLERTAARAQDSPEVLLFEWDTQDVDEGWMVSYADMLSVILAMVVLLLGRMVMTTLPVADAELRTEIGTDVADEVAAEIAYTEVPPRRQDDPPDRSTENREAGLADLVEARFQGKIEAEPQEQGLLLKISDVVLFESAAARLQESAIPMLADLAATLKQLGETEVAVEGHTDSRAVLGGDFESNWDLAAARANAVTEFLLAQGYDPGRVHSVSYADTRPVSDNDSESGRAANRRVELRIHFLK
jgi:chemotaxis protein MotB